MKDSKSKNALLIIDMQNDFLPGGSLAVKEANELIPLINDLLKLPFDLKIATQDWHPKEHISFASTHGKNPFDTLKMDHKIQHLWNDHCVQGTFGAKLSDQMELNQIAHVFQKGVSQEVDSYSAFFDENHKQSTGLFDFLKEAQISEIYVVGVALEYCVKYTVLDALKLGIRVHLIVDATKALNFSADDDLLALAEMKNAGAILDNSKNVFSAFL